MTDVTKLHRFGREDGSL